jgi:hypothetical protein
MEEEKEEILPFFVLTLLDRLTSFAAPSGTWELKLAAAATILEGYNNSLCRTVAAHQ